MDTGAATSPLMFEKPCWFRKRPIHLTLAIILVISALLSACNPVPSPQQTIGEILDKAAAQVEGIIQTASAQVQTDVLVAAGQVQVLIHQAASAYATLLDQTMDQVNASVANTITQIEGLVTDLNTTVTATLQNATDMSQQLLLALPFTNKNPQVTSYAPRFIAAGSSSVHVRVKGLFAYAAQKGLVPSLTVNQTTVQPNVNTDNELGFDIPAKLLPTPGAGVATLQLDLNVPFEYGIVFHSTHLSAFRLLLTIAPTNPVQRLELTNEEPTTVQQVKYAPKGAPIGGSWSLNAQEDCKTKTDQEKVFADPGWQIAHAEVGYDINDFPQAQSVQVAFTPQEIDVDAKAVAVLVPAGNLKCIGGNIAYYVKYTEVGPGDPNLKTVDLAQGLTWNGSVYGTLSHDWHLHAVMFNGATCDYVVGSPEKQAPCGPMLQVTYNASQIVVSATFSDINLPSTAQF